MKFQQLAPFTTHFQKALITHLSPIYAVISPLDSTRKKILSEMREPLSKRGDFKLCQTIQEALEHLNTHSLFANQTVALFDGVETLSKHELEALSHYLKAPNEEGCLILGAGSSKAVLDLYKSAKREMVVLDLSKEKPWEEKDRLQKEVMATLKQQEKEIDPQALAFLFQILPKDRLAVDQELEKLIVYTSGRKIVKEDVMAICTPSFDYNVFQMARELVFSTTRSFPKLDDPSTLFPLVSSLRSQLETGLKMTVLIKRGTASYELSSHFPRLYPKALEQVVSAARSKGEFFFKNGLIALFELEFGLKTSFGRPHILWDIFCASLTRNL